MAFPSIFNQEDVAVLIHRIHQLNPQSKAQWGKMNVSQMLAHCCIPYEQIFEERKDKTPFFMKWILRLFFKKSMVNEVPYKPSLPTAPAFIVHDQREFEKEQKRLIKYIERCRDLRAEELVKRKQATLGYLTEAEWNNLIYKHLDHHLRQFGV